MYKKSVLIFAAVILFSILTNQTQQVKADPGDPYVYHQFQCFYNVEEGVWTETGCSEGFDPSTWRDNWDVCNGSAGTQFDGEWKGDEPWNGTAYYNVYCWSGTWVPPTDDNTGNVPAKFIPPQIIQPREAKYSTVESVPLNSDTARIEYWQGGDVVLAQRMDDHTIFYFRIDGLVLDKNGKAIHGSIIGNHFGDSVDGVPHIS